MEFEKIVWPFFFIFKCFIYFQLRLGSIYELETLKKWLRYSTLFTNNSYFSFSSSSLSLSLFSYFLLSPLPSLIIPQPSIYLPPHQSFSWFIYHPPLFSTLLDSFHPHSFLLVSMLSHLLICSPSFSLCLSSSYYLFIWPLCCTLFYFLLGLLTFFFPSLIYFLFSLYPYLTLFLVSLFYTSFSSSSSSAFSLSFILSFYLFFFPLSLFLIPPICSLILILPLYLLLIHSTLYLFFHSPSLFPYFYFTFLLLFPTILTPPAQSTYLDTFSLSLELSLFLF